MRSGLEIGQTAEIHIVVDESMQASLMGKPIHPLYGTAAMIEHMEWAARQHILPYLEAGEEGVGHEVNIQHLAPAPMGANIQVRSTLTELQPRRVVSTVEAWWDQTLIGQGTLVQALVQVEKFYPAMAQKTEPLASEQTGTNPPPAILCADNGKDKLQLEVLKWENGLYACTRYDEWLVCRIDLYSGAEHFQYEGACLLRYELEEWLDAFQRMTQDPTHTYQSDFLEPVLNIHMMMPAMENLWTCAIQFHPSHLEHHQVSFHVSGQAIQQFCKTLVDQLEGFLSRL
jgi:fluoroacetyl-CoA thioesterase